jgi:glycosyltransferase involved in cell wall biosynthesis
MNSDPFFSIIIPTYNREKFILTTIQSVLNQSFENLEVIVVDDGSIDGTCSVVESLIRNDTRVSYFYQSNSERSVARNNGVEKANGQFLIFLDSDDFFNTLNHLENLYNYIKSNKYSEGLYFTGATIVSTKGIKYTRNYSKDELNRFDFFVNESVVPARVCISRNIFNHFKFDEDCIVVEDTVLWTIVMDIFPVLYIPIHSVTYQLHDNNSVNISKTNAYMKRMKGLQKLFTKYPIGSKIPISTKQKHINRCYFGISDYYRNKNMFLLSKFWLFISLIKYPKIEFKHKIKMLFLHI